MFRKFQAKLYGMLFRELFRANAKRPSKLKEQVFKKFFEN